MVRGNRAVWCIGSGPKSFPEPPINVAAQVGALEGRMFFQAPGCLRRKRILMAGRTLIGALREAERRLRAARLAGDVETPLRPGPAAGISLPRVPVPLPGKAAREATARVRWGR